MVVYTTSQHPTALVLCLCVWAVDLYLVLTAIRLVLSGVNASWARRVATKLAPFTDPILSAVRNAMITNNTPPPLWLAYIVVLLTGTVLRQTLLWTALHFR
jgi:uncharacterized protein YggT (Ycf19 family)